MQLTTAIERLCDATAAEGRSGRTVEGYEKTLRYLVEFLGDPEIETIDVADLRRYAADLRTRSERYANNPYAATQEGGLSPFTVASYLRSVKRLFNWLLAEELIAVNPAARLKVPQPAKREPKALSLDDFGQMLAAVAGDDPTQIRDRAILLFLADTGCRAGGLCHLRIKDVDLGRMAVKLTEKGEKTRIIPFSEMTRDALQRWLAARPAVAESWLFVTMGPRVTSIRLTEEGLKEMLRRLKKRSGVTGHVNPHSFRHGFAREWIRNGGDISTLARVLGHSDPAVTARFYSVFSDQELVEFHQRYSPVSRMGSSPKSSSNDQDK